MGLKYVAIYFSSFSRFSLMEINTNFSITWYYCKYRGNFSLGNCFFFNINLNFIMLFLKPIFGSVNGCIVFWGGHSLCWCLDAALCCVWDGTGFPYWKIMPAVQTASAGFVFKNKPFIFSAASHRCWSLPLCNTGVAIRHLEEKKKEPTQTRWLWQGQNAGGVRTDLWGDQSALRSFQEDIVS